MSLKKKIALSFFVSAALIAILVVFEYINFARISTEIRGLEVTDTLRSKSLQLRRHEKNFFLYGPLKAPEEVEAVYSYLRELSGIAQENARKDGSGGWVFLKDRVRDYEEDFRKIEGLYRQILHEFERSAISGLKSSNSLPLLELTILEHPLLGAEFLRKEMLLAIDHQLIGDLQRLDAAITSLRKGGEDILAVSKELDRTARENADRVVYISQIALFVFFPLFLIVGLGTLFFIASNVVKQLKLLISVVERTGEGEYPHLTVSGEGAGSADEVDTLIRKFNQMEDQLRQRERELLQSKKLAAIGTLASGVAHELNNPLNNIYLSAQVLEREAGGSFSAFVKETINDIVGQTVRVKRIVGDLLEFAKGKEPEMREVDLNELIRGAYKLVSLASDTSSVNFVLHTDAKGVKVSADPEQIERVFINLFSNAVDAMAGRGSLNIAVREEKGTARITVSDSGRGIDAEEVEKIFEPFYTTKHKGTGLGLAITFNIVKKHGGEISVESEKGRGTTFVITLPGGKGQQ